MIEISHLWRETWRITRTSPALWLLSGANLLAIIPTVLLSGGLGAVAGLLSLPARLQPDWLAPVRSWLAWRWVVIWLAAVGALILASLLAYLLQAAVIRGAALAAQQGRPPTLAESLNLGRARALRLAGLSVTLGGALNALALLPVLARLLLGGQLEGPGNTVLAAGQSTLPWLLSVTGVAVFLLTLAIAVEEVRVRQAPGRAWAVFRQGWWAFLLILGLSTIPSFVVAALLLPAAFLAPVAVFSPVLGLALIGLYCLASSPIVLALLILVAVFTNTLYTLVYQAAARLADQAAG